MPRLPRISASPARVCGTPSSNARRHAQMQEDLARLHQLVMEIRCCNSGLFNPVPRIRTDTDEMLKIIERLDAQEEPDGV